MAGETEVEDKARLYWHQERVDMHACVHTLTYVYMYLFTCIHVSIYMYLFTCIYVSIYLPVAGESQVEGRAQDSGQYAQGNGANKQDQVTLTLYATCCSTFLLLSRPFFTCVGVGVSVCACVCVYLCVCVCVCVCAHGRVYVGVVAVSVSVA